MASNHLNDVKTTKGVVKKYRLGIAPRVPIAAGYKALATKQVVQLIRNEVFLPRIHNNFQKRYSVTCTDNGKTLRSILG